MRSPLSISSISATRCASARAERTGFLPLLEADRRRNEECSGEHDPGQEMARAAKHRARASGAGERNLARGHAMPLEGPLPGHLQARRSLRRQPEAGVQSILDRPGKLRLVVHSSMPLALSAAAKVCVAREQCVFTLPSEHPITAAVSATSNSSQ